MSTVIRVPLLIIFLTTLTFQLSTSVQAQTSPIHLGITPPLTHVVIQPGRSATHAITIENAGSQNVEVVPLFRDFTGDNETGNPVIQEEMSFPYIILSTPEKEMNKPFDLLRGTQQQLVFQIDVPETALEREYHFVVLLEATPQGDTLGEESHAKVKTQIASNFIVTVTQDARDQGIIELSSFEAPIIVDSFWPISSKIFMKNVGKNMTVTLGTFSIQNVFNQVVYEIDLLPQNILPGKSREVLGAKPVQNNNEEFMEPTPLRYKPFFLLGPYTMTVTYHAPNQDEQRFEHRVFALPVSVLIALIFFYSIYLVYTKTDLFTFDKKSNEPFQGK